MRESLVAAVSAVALCSALMVSAADPAAAKASPAAPKPAAAKVAAHGRVAMAVPRPPLVPGKDEKGALEVIAALKDKKYNSLYFLEYDDEGWTAKNLAAGKEIELKVNARDLKVHVEDRDENDDPPPAKGEKSMEDVAKLALAKHPGGVVVTMEYDSSEWEVEVVVGGKDLILTYNAKNGELLDEY